MFWFRRFGVFYALSFLLALSTGCDDKVKIYGRVTYPDGSPLTCGQIVFTDDYYMAKSDVDREGAYYLHSFNRRDGIRKGVYKVYINSAFIFEETEPDPEDLMRGRVELASPTQCVDNQYMCPDTSGWLIKVDKSQKIDFTVYRPGEVPDSERTREAREWFDRFLDDKDGKDAADR